MGPALAPVAAAVPATAAATSPKTVPASNDIFGVFGGGPCNVMQPVRGVVVAPAPPPGVALGQENSLLDLDLLLDSGSTGLSPSKPSTNHASAPTSEDLLNSTMKSFGMEDVLMPVDSLSSSLSAQGTSTAPEMSDKVITEWLDRLPDLSYLFALELVSTGP